MQLPQKIAVAAASSRFNPRPPVIGQLLGGKKSTPWQPDKPIKSPADMTAATAAGKNVQKSRVATAFTYMGSQLTATVASKSDYMCAHLFIALSYDLTVLEEGEEK